MTVLADMSTSAHVLVIVLAAGVIGFIVHLVRSRQLRAKYSVLWFSIGLALAVLAIFPDLLVELSDVFGIDYAPATFMLLALSFLLLLVLHFSWELSRLEDRSRRLAEELALVRLERELERADGADRVDLRDGSDGGDGGDGGDPEQPSPSEEHAAH